MYRTICVNCKEQVQLARLHFSCIEPSVKGTAFCIFKMSEKDFMKFTPHIIRACIILIQIEKLIFQCEKMLNRYKPLVMWLVLKSRNWILGSVLWEWRKIYLLLGAVQNHSSTYKLKLELRVQLVSRESTLLATLLVHMIRRFKIQNFK